MILSASRRTDIPAFFSDWFFRRIKDGFFMVRNPMNAHQVSRVDITPDLVDCIVFWTKDPQPMLGRLGELSDMESTLAASTGEKGATLSGMLRCAQIESFLGQREMQAGLILLSV